MSNIVTGRLLVLVCGESLILIAYCYGVLRVSMMGGLGGVYLRAKN